MPSNISRSAPRYTAKSEKPYFVSGYAVTAMGYTRSAKTTVNAVDHKQAVIRAAERLLEREGLTDFRAMKVLEINTRVSSDLH